MRLTLSSADRRLLDSGKRQRAMTWVIAIMVFLTVLAAALGLGMLSAGHVLDRQLAGRLTVQVVEADPAVRDRDAARVLTAMKELPVVRKAVAVDRAALAALVRPWLGEEGADPDLPIPAMIDLDLSDPSDATVTRVEAAARAVSPAARIDRHTRWLSPVSQFMGLLTWLALGLVLLMAGATAAVVILAARAGLETHRETIGVLHMLGSTDVQVARLFQRRIALDALGGGIIGALLAAGVVALIGSRLGSLGSDLLGGVALATRDWILLGLMPVAFALLATFAARLAVLGQLKRVL